MGVTWGRHSQSIESYQLSLLCANWAVWKGAGVAKWADCVTWCKLRFQASHLNILSLGCFLWFGLLCWLLTVSSCSSFYSPLAPWQPGRGCVFFFGCVGSSLLRAGFLYLRRARAILCCSAWASHCGGFSCCGAWALGARASVVAARGLSSCSMQALEHAGFSSCGSRALEHRLISCGTRA